MNQKAKELLKYCLEVISNDKNRLNKLGKASVREFKFRAIVDEMSPRWAYGMLIYNGDIPCIQEDRTKALFTTCLKGTECEYTGLMDKNGNDLYFDSDLCEVEDVGGLWFATKDDFGIPCWLPEAGGLGVHIEFSTYFLNGTRRKNDFVIVGNVHENPEPIEQ